MMGTPIDVVLTVRNLCDWRASSDRRIHLRSLNDGSIKSRERYPSEILIEIISARLKTATSQDHYPLARMLEAFLWRAERNCEASEVLDTVIEYPDDVGAPIGDPEGALKSIDVALERAYRTGFSRREALGNKARILPQAGPG